MKNKHIYLGKGYYTSLEEIFNILIKVFPDGFRSQDASGFLKTYFFNKGIYTVESRIKEWSYIFRRLYENNYLTRSLIQETKGKDGKMKRWYFYRFIK